jgi:cytochrome c
MRAFARERGAWSEELLDRYIADPEKAVPKTTMAFRGVEEADERADLVAYLKAARLPDSPQP